MSGTGALETVRHIAVADMVMVVGDIVAFSSIAEYTDDRVLLENIDRLYARAAADPRPASRHAQQLRG